MFVSSNARQFSALWMRRFANYFIGVTSASVTVVMLLGAVLVFSGVLEW